MHTTTQERNSGYKMDKNAVIGQSIYMTVTPVPE